MTLKTELGLIAAEDISGVWVRRFNPPFSKAASYDQMARRFATGESQMMVDALAHVWPESTPWISKPGLINKACNKPYNLMMAQQMGFRIPETVYSNEVEKATAFLQSHTPVAMKTLSTLWMSSGKQETPTPDGGVETTNPITVFYVRKYDSEQLISGIDSLPGCPH